jgi:protocatechuate 3,4-dioxygenase beta subunit
LEYRPYDPKTQLARYIDRYPLSFKRTPLAPLIERPLTMTERTGPTGLGRGLPIGELDLSGATAGGSRATGQLISISGRITGEDGAPIEGAVIELWQANSAGKYIHEMDRHEAPVDPNFTGEGRMVTDADGQYKLLSIKPGAYPVLES